MELNYNSKKAQGFIYSYKRSITTDLRQVYKSYSAEKARAEAYCRNDCYFFHGHNFKIISHNCMKFTCAYLVDNYLDNGKALIVHTACHKYVIYLPESEVI